MRKFKTRLEGIVDLDDPRTYDHLPKGCEELDRRMFMRIGQALIYVKYFYPDWDKAQKGRINVLIKNFADNRRENYKNFKWYREQLFLFEEETENMC